MFTHSVHHLCMETIVFWITTCSVFFHSSRRAAVRVSTLATVWLWFLTLVSNIPQIFSMGFRSGDIPGHSRHWMSLSAKGSWWYGLSLGVHYKPWEGMHHPNDFSLARRWSGKHFQDSTEHSCCLGRCATGLSHLWRFKPRPSWIHLPNEWQQLQTGGCFIVPRLSTHVNHHQHGLQWCWTHLLTRCLTIVHCSNGSVP